MTAAKASSTGIGGSRSVLPTRPSQEQENARPEVQMRIATRRVGFIGRRSTHYRENAVPVPHVANRDTFGQNGWTPAPVGNIVDKIKYSKSVIYGTMLI